MQTAESEPSADAATRGRSAARKWGITGVLFLATVLTYLDRNTLAICEYQIRAEFHLTDEGYGYLLSAFRWAYALMQIPAGLMADRLPLRSTFGLAVGLWSLAGAAAAFVVRVPALMAARAVLGMGETFNWPCSSRIVANSFKPADRSLASGIFNGGAAVGSLISPLAIGGIALAFGWRMAFLSMGALGGAWLVLWLAVTARRGSCRAAVRSKWNFGPRATWAFAAAFLAIGAGLPAVVVFLGPRLIAIVAALFGTLPERIAAMRGTLTLAALSFAALLLFGSLLRWKTKALAFWLLIVVSVTVTPCWYFMNEWLIKTLREDRGLPETRVLATMTLILLVADLGNLVCGGVIKSLVRRGWPLRAARGATMIAAACLIAPVCVVDRTENLPLATAILGLAGFGLTSIVAAFTACQQDLSFRRVGLMTGVVGACANVVTAIANPAIGAHHDATHSYRALFVLLGTLPLVSVAAILAFDAIVHGGRRNRGEADALGGMVDS